MDADEYQRRVVAALESLAATSKETHSAIEDVTESLDDIGELLTRILPPKRPRATWAFLVVTPAKKGPPMPGQITVDTTNETATIEFVDDKGDTNAAAPSNASGNVVATFTSDNESVATVAADASNPYQADITPVAEGTANIGATLAYPDGSAVFEADGVTPFPDPASVEVTVGPGAAVGDALVLSI
jgi:hypothetical protein